MLNIICFGDSITEATEFLPAERWTVLLQGKLDSFRPGAFRVYNRGVNGNTTAQGFDRYWTDILPLLPGILIIQFGFNDANVKDLAIVPRVGLPEFQKNLREFQRIAAVHHSPAIFIINHRIGNIDGKQGNGRSYKENLGPYNDAIRNIASDLGAPIIDLPALMQERGIHLENFLSIDHLHLTVEGNRYYAEMVFSELIETGVLSADRQEPKDITRMPINAGVQSDP